MKRKTKWWQHIARVVAVNQVAIRRRRREIVTCHVKEVEGGLSPRKSIGCSRLSALLSGKQLRLL